MKTLAIDRRVNSCSVLRSRATSRRRRLQPFMTSSNASSHDTFELRDDERAAAHHFDLDAEDGRTWPVRCVCIFKQRDHSRTARAQHSPRTLLCLRCCGCFFISWARRWETGLRAADVAALERRQKANEWSNMMALVGDSTSESMPSASIPSASDGHEGDGDRSETSSSYLSHPNSFSRRGGSRAPGGTTEPNPRRLHPVEMSLMVREAGAERCEPRLQALSLA